MNPLAFLKIRRSERSVLTLSISLGFIVGGLLCYISSVPLAMFLENYSSENLPYIYILGALVTLGFGLVFSQTEKRLSFKKLTQALILFLAVSAALFWLLVILGEAKIIFFIIVIWALLAFSILEMSFWMVINNIYTIQQGKRLFGVIGGMQSLGGALAGFLSPWVISKLGVNNIILLISVVSLIAYAILLVLEKRFVHDEEIVEVEDEEDSSKSRALSIRKILKNNYVMKIFLIVALCVIGDYTVDFLFNTLAEVHYPSEAALAGFLGTVFGTVDLLDFLCSTFLLAWVLTRFGVIVNLLIQPITMILIAFLLGFFNLIPVWASVVFWCVVLLKIFEETFRAAFLETGSLLLLQPMLPVLRGWIQSKIEMFVSPVASFIIGVILLLMNHFVGFRVKYFSLGIICVFGLMTVVLLTFKKNYIKALANAISNRNFVKPVFEKIDKDSLPLFKKYLKSSYPEELIYALSILENADKNEFINELKLAFLFDNEVVKQFALDKMEEYKAYQYTDLARNLALNDPAPLVRARALTALASKNNKEILTWVSEFMSDSSLLVSSAAILALLDSDDVEFQKVALNNLQKMQESSELKLQLACIKIISDSKCKVAESLLTAFVNSSETEVKIAALKVAIRRHLSQFYAIFMENLSETNIENGLLEDFSSLGAEVVSIIALHFPRYDIYVQSKLIKIIGEINTESSFKFLETLLQSKSMSIRNDALEKILESNKRPSLEFIAQQLTLEIQQLELQARNLALVPVNETSLVLRDALRRRLQLLARGILLKLKFFYSPELIGKAKAAFETYGIAEVSYAAELLDSILKSKHKKNIVALMLLTYGDEFSEGSKKNDSYEILRTYLQETNDPVDQLICAASLFVISKLSLPGFSEEIAAFSNSPILIIRETALA